MGSPETGHARLLAPLAHLFGESRKVIEQAGVEAILRSVESDFERLVQGDAVRDLSYLDEGASDPQIHDIVSDMSVAQSRVFAARDAEAGRLQGATAARKLDGKTDILRRYEALIQELEAQIRRRDASAGRYFTPLKRLLAADEEREIDRLRASLEADLATFDRQWVPPNQDRHKRKFDMLNAALERLKVSVKRASASKAIQQRVDEVCQELFSNGVLPLHS